MRKVSTLLALALVGALANGQVSSGPDQVFAGAASHVFTDNRSNCYIGSTNAGVSTIRRVNRNGTIAWIHTVGAPSFNSTLASDGSIVIVFSAPTSIGFRRLNQNTGAVLSFWQQPTGTESFQGFTGQGHPLFKTSNGRVFCRSHTTGTALWQRLYLLQTVELLRAWGNRVAIAYKTVTQTPRTGYIQHEMRLDFDVVDAETGGLLFSNMITRYDDFQFDDDPLFVLGYVQGALDFLADGRIVARGASMMQVPGRDYQVAESTSIFGPTGTKLRTIATSRVEAVVNDASPTMSYIRGRNSVSVGWWPDFNVFIKYHRVITPTSQLSEEFTEEVGGSRSAIDTLGNRDTWLEGTQSTTLPDQWFTIRPDGTLGFSIPRPFTAGPRVPTPSDGMYVTSASGNVVQVRRMRASGTFGPTLNMATPGGSTLGAYWMEGSPDTDLWVIRNYTLSGGSKSCRVARLITAPIGRADYYTTTAGTPLNVTAPTLLANDTDPDGDPLVSLLYTAPDPAKGTVSGFTTTGRFRFAPAPGFRGNADFYYRVRDSFNRYSSPILVRVTAR